MGPVGIFTYSSQGAIIGQIFVGLICDRVGRKAALIFTTLLIVIGATIGTAAHGAHGSVQGLFWCLTFARGITGIVSNKFVNLYRLFIRDSMKGVGGEYPASSTSASEAANEKMVKQRGPGEQSEVKPLTENSSLNILIQFSLWSRISF